MSAMNESPPSLAVVETRKPADVILHLTPLDQRQHRGLVGALDAAIRRVSAKLQPLFNLSSALDAACGVGTFSRTLAECGLHACGIDAREEQIAEARRRYPQLLFERAHLEDRGIVELRSFDFVVCFDLLHSLENPLLALQNLRALTGKCLLLESMCIPNDRPAMRLRDRSHTVGRDQTVVTWYLNEGSLVKMLYLVGFSYVYRLTPLPNHEDFRDTPDRARKRTVLLASTSSIDLAGFRLCPEPHEPENPWSTSAPARRSFLKRVARFTVSPLRRKYLAVALRMRRVFPEMPIPLRLPFGVWWLAQDGALDHDLMYDGFEGEERRVVRRFLRPGMTVVDIGAHHGLYTLLASKCVGRKGRVIAFEPSPREFARLAQHVRFNRCSNVTLQQCALGDHCGEADLFQVDGFRDWGNSLRRPDVPEPTRTLRVPLRTLDHFVAAGGIARVDFIKLDAEGAELSVLEGARSLLQSALRPVILAEVEDRRTRPWGYAAREIIHCLAAWNYRWLALSESGALYPALLNEDSYDGNFLAVPAERVDELGPFPRTD
ncbi:MAG TPA: FkbM family methyltransferase [Candidatus Acidoferrum sp.]|nr:FkbM family methyltransferase [Candidatus Acidoferrum sp.]